jgi:hypothetical protein
VLEDDASVLQSAGRRAEHAAVLQALDQLYGPATHPLRTARLLLDKAKAAADEPPRRCITAAALALADQAVALLQSLHAGRIPLSGDTAFADIVGDELARALVWRGLKIRAYYAARAAAAQRLASLDQATAASAPDSPPADDELGRTEGTDGLADIGAALQAWLGAARAGSTWTASRDTTANHLRTCIAGCLFEMRSELLKH